jgi:hypothetical protein
LQELNATVPEYIKSVWQFQYENKTWRIVLHFVSPNYMKCDVCGNFPIIVVFVIRTGGEKLNVSNECIDRITNRKVSKWFKDYRLKRKNIIRNRSYIDDVSSILAAYKNNKLPIQISKIDIEELQKMLGRMCNGKKPYKKARTTGKILHKQNSPSMQEMTSAQAFS